jgi:hypothetical protein
LGIVELCEDLEAAADIKRKNVGIDRKCMKNGSWKSS